MLWRVTGLSIGNISCRDKMYTVTTIPACVVSNLREAGLSTTKAIGAAEHEYCLVLRGN